MPLFPSTRGARAVPFAEALASGLAPDGGLYVPAPVPRLGEPPEALARGWAASARWAAGRLLPGVSPDALGRIVREALDFEVPLVETEPGLRVLELFHGPSHAFKDVGARFMARAMRLLLPPSPVPRTVLVATSGDTGGAVASAFHGLDGHRVVVLFPVGGVSEHQRRQMTTLGGNVLAVGVAGTFDDCQRLAKAAFADRALRDTHALTSANSINVGRLLPQALYYVHAARLSGWSKRPVRFVVPSGNLGNLCAGLLAWRAGMPAAGFVAASNRNDAFPDFLATGRFTPRPSLPTLSNAMDVGAPSNLERIRWLFRDDPAQLTARVAGEVVDDERTLARMADVYERTGYVLDPHTAVAYEAALRHRGSGGAPLVVLATAHPAKFPDVVRRAIGREPPTASGLDAALCAPEQYRDMEPTMEALRSLLGETR